MCDCYVIKCEQEGCSIKIPVHISDSCTSRNNIKSYCKKHITDKCLVFQLPDGKKDMKGIVFPRGYKIGFEIINISKVDMKRHTIDVCDKDYKKHPVVSPNITNWEWIK